MDEQNGFYLRHDELTRATFLALRSIILQQDKDITSQWKYGMPFFYYKNKMFCYLWFHKKYKKPYLGMVEGRLFNEPFFIQENRSRIKIMLFDPNEDLPIQDIVDVLQKAVCFYKTKI